MVYHKKFGFLFFGSILSILFFPALSLAVDITVQGNIHGCGDSVCDSQLGETCSSCPADCGTCPVSPPAQVGGVATVKVSVEETTVTFPSIAPNTPRTIDVEKLGTSFTELHIEVNKIVISAKIIINKLAQKPAEVSEISNVYQFINITGENIEDADVSKMKIKFKVEKSWFAVNEINETTTVLNRFTNTWIKLPTRRLNNDSTYVYFESEFSGLSLFAISGETIKVAPVTKVPTEEITPELPTEAPPAPITPLAIGLSTAIILAVTGFIVSKKRKQKKYRFKVRTILENVKKKFKEETHES